MTTLLNESLYSQIPFLWLNKAWPKEKFHLSPESPLCTIVYHGGIPSIIDNSKSSESSKEDALRGKRTDCDEQTNM
jgi:hypothetical protein